jgi:membrane-associated protein
MDRKKFAFYNIVGCMLWVGSMLVGGHFLQKFILKEFDFDLKEHLEVIIIAIVLLSTFPVIWKLFFSKKKDPTIEIGKEITKEKLTPDPE